MPLRRKERGACALCREPDAVLLESHIIPEFMLKDAVEWLPRGKSGNPQPFIEEVKYDTLEVTRSNLKARVLAAEGIIQPFLCASCEERLHKGEDYVRKALYGGGRKKVHTRSYRERRWYKTAANGRPYIRGLEFKQVDYRLFRQFQLGVAWRCCAATGPAFDNIVVPAALQELLRLAILADSPPARLVPCEMEKLIGLQPVWLECLGLPQIHDGALLIIMGGYRWYFHLEADFRGIVTLTEDGQLITKLSNSDLHENLPNW
jgi:hypothetical protein